MRRATRPGQTTTLPSWSGTPTTRAAAHNSPHTHRPPGYDDCRAGGRPAGRERGADPTRQSARHPPCPAIPLRAEQQLDTFPCARSLNRHQPPATPHGLGVPNPLSARLTAGIPFEGFPSCRPCTERASGAAARCIRRPGQDVPALVGARPHERAEHRGAGGALPSTPSRVRARCQRYRSMFIVVRGCRAPAFRRPGSARGSRGPLGANLELKRAMRLFDKRCGVHDSGLRCRPF